MKTKSLEDQFTEIFLAENDALFRFCLFRISDRERALELTQETFTRLWKEIAVGKGVPPNPRAFLYLVARRLVIDWYRKTKTSSLDVPFEEGEAVVEPADPQAHEAPETLAEAGRALRLIEDLPEPYKEVMYLRFVEERPPREIAEMLELTPNAVSVRLTRGLAALRKAAHHS